MQYSHFAEGETNLFAFVLVGSRAQGLSNSNSDYDYRAITTLSPFRSLIKDYPAVSLFDFYKQLCNGSQSTVETLWCPAIASNGWKTLILNRHLFINSLYVNRLLSSSMGMYNAYIKDKNSNKLDAYRLRKKKCHAFRSLFIAESLINKQPYSLSPQKDLLLAIKYEDDDSLNFEDYYYYLRSKNIDLPETDRQAQHNLFLEICSEPGFKLERDRIREVNL